MTIILVNYDGKKLIMQIVHKKFFLGEFVMNWLPVFILITILVVTFIPTPKKSEESNDHLSC